MEAEPTADHATSEPSATPAVVPACGPICTGNHTTGSAANPIRVASFTSCADAQATFDSYIVTEANVECQNWGYIKGCNVHGYATQPCYKSGSYYIVEGYETFSCRDTTC